MNGYLVVAIVFAAAAVGAVAWALRERMRAAAAELRVELLREQAELVTAQLTQSATGVAEAILKKNEEALHNRDQLAQARLEAQLKPVAETLKKFEEKVQTLDAARQKEAGGMAEQINNLLKVTASSRDETRKLTDALKRAPNVRGRWGEQSLRNVLEACGLNDRFDFTEQATIEGDDGRALRPDVLVHLAGGGVMVIDSKVNLNPYMDALDAVDEAARADHTQRFIRGFRGHVDALSRKPYWDQFKKPPYERSPAFVVMYVPGENFLSAALDAFPSILDDARQERVLIATPTSLFALLQVVAMGWRAEDQARNADQIAALGQELYGRLSTMTSHVQDLGTHLGRAVTKFNSFVGSLQDRVLPQARKFEALGSDHQSKNIPDLEELEIVPREIREIANGLIAGTLKTHDTESPVPHLDAPEQRP
jgi:DNA recombination protein RmuC